mmetsp:Transcript_30081/g.65623  ORF Transcript_30081/g.65623 Transcript_30081/m.65623 type:complete len:884 (-) Transcript_30081:222-2873(-)
MDLPFFLLRTIFKLIVIVVQVLVVLWFLWVSYDIRLYPIKDFGYIIHEFDPWFNYRATEYLAEHGLDKFFKWYDYESWYPLGRPVGTTIYPGMQMAGVAIWETMKKIPAFSYKVDQKMLFPVKAFYSTLRYMGFMRLPPMPKAINFVPMSVNDICCMMPAWFAVVAALFCGLLAMEVSPYRSVNAFVMTVGIMAIIPAGLMRSVAGEFDNEAVAMAVICATFFLWIRSVRTPSSWPFGVLAGLSYAYMVATWGGYIFVLNMIGVHALMLVGLGRFNSGVYKAYTLFFVIGTFGAIQIPVVGLQPFRSMEQLGPLGVFLGYQVLAFCDARRRSAGMDAKEFAVFRIKVFVAFGLALGAVVVVLLPTGYFGPLSSRIRGLFVKHTKTGNPLVDSVAEHQPASPSMYQAYLNLPLDYAYYGGLICLWKRTNGVYFLFLYCFVASHFSGKMSRLVLICAPVVSVACGVWCGFLLDQILEPFLLLLGKKGFKGSAVAIETPPVSNSKPQAKQKNDKKGKEKEKEPEKPKKKAKGSNKTKIELEEWDEDVRPGGMAQLKRTFKASVYESLPGDLMDTLKEARVKMDNDKNWVLGRAFCVVVILFAEWNFGGLSRKVRTFVNHADQVARSLSNPQVVYQVQQRDGTMLKVDDYLKGYQWIDQNTPKDSRVMAWWDYGYQITGIARRTSIADGNTWNHEHIATLGRTLTSPEKRAWNAIRHLADYVLVWAGGHGDDLGKSPHLARIGNSVFPDHCGDDDPKCNKFSFYQDGSPTPMMARSLLYKLVKNGLAPGVKVNENLFQEVHSTKFGLMRVYKVMNVSQESKDWVADPKNRVCDAPGSWYCVGQYPPALEKLIAKRRNFAQVEDFNRGGAKSAYTRMIEKEYGGGGEL